MNWKYVLHILGILIVLEAIFMLLTVFVSFEYGEKVEFEIVLSFLITLFSGLTLAYFFRKAETKFYRREGFLLVSLAWIVISLFGTLPYLLTQSIPNFIDAFFESVSGFTTTGSSILTDIESLPNSVLFWRSETHWLGGMGIIVLFIALFPSMRTQKIFLFSAEASVVVENKTLPQWLTTARWLWIIYLSFTLLEAFLLHLGGMNVFDSINHAFATVATGGFSTKNDSIASFNPFIQYTIAIFMILSGTNFTIYLLFLRKKFKTALRNEELLAYLSIIFVATFTLTFILHYEQHLNLEKAFRDSLFQVASIITATGFATTDYLQWAHHAWFIIVILMLIGASSGSTGGGVKVIRYVLFFKTLRFQIKKILHPEMVFNIKYNGRPVCPNTIRNVIVFIIFYYFLVGIGTVVLSLDGVDPITAFGSVLTAMGGMGPGLGQTGPAGNFSQLPYFSKLALTFFMITGRLEIFTFLSIFTKGFYKNF